MTAPVPVILSGGAGTRLWPLSREMMPKQLLRLAGGDRAAGPRRLDGDFRHPPDRTQHRLWLHPRRPAARRRLRGRTLRRETRPRYRRGLRRLGRLSGIFLLPTRVFLAELERLDPAILAGCRAALAAGRTDLFFFRLDPAAFGALDGRSIDHAVMEKSDRVAVVPVEMGWSDVGSWSALARESVADEAGNVVRGEGPLVAAVGLRDLVVVATENAVLVADKAADQQVKAVVERLKAATRRPGVGAAGGRGAGSRASIVANAIRSS